MAPSDDDCATSEDSGEEDAAAAALVGACELPVAYAQWRRTGADPVRKPVDIRVRHGKYGPSLKRGADSRLFRTPLSSFLTIFTDTTFNHIALCTSPHLTALGEPTTCVSELKIFVALVITMGLRKQPTLKSYWNASSFGVACSRRSCCALDLVAHVSGSRFEADRCVLLSFSDQGQRVRESDVA